MRKLFFTILLVMTLPAWAGGLNPVGGIGSRHGGMSGAYADDMILFRDNPAGIINLEDSLDFGVQAIQPKFKIKNRLGTHGSRDDMVYPMPLLGLTKSINKDAVWGIGIMTPYGMGAAFDADWSKGFFKSETLISLTNITPAISLRLTDHLSVGAGLNVGWCQFKYLAPFDIKNVYLPILTDSEATGLGLGANVGVMWQTEKLTLGLSYMSELKAHLEGNTKISGPLGLLSLKDGFYSSFTFPDMTSLSVSCQANKKLLLAASLHWYGYSQTVDDVKLSFHDLPLTKGKLLDWRDNYSVHVGFRKEIQENLWLSGGIGYQNAAVPEGTVSQLTPDVTGWDVALGFHQKVNDDWTLNTHVIYGWGDMQDSRGNEFKAKTVTIGFGADWKF